MRITIFLAIALLAFSCTQVEYDLDNFTPLYGTGTDHAGELFEQLSDKKIYFGHQSVGRNILGGLESWLNETGASMEIVESRDFSNVPGAALVHFAVGQNGDPIGKVDDFVSMMDQVSEEEQALAFFKFCYVDFTSETDVERIYAHLKKNMLELEERYPQISFIASTVPYTGVQGGLRALAKKILGQAPYGALENIKRKEFNDLVMTDLSEILPVFDLGAAQTTRPDGSLESYRYKGEDYPCIPAFYRSDYGHLNASGSRIVSFNLLAFLAQVLD